MSDIEHLMVKHIMPAALLLAAVVFMYWNGRCGVPHKVKEPREERVEPKETKNVGEWFKTMFNNPSPWIN